MDKNSYYKQREISCMEKLNIIIDELPYYVQEFFIGLELRTSALTRLNYGYDLRVFFDFLTKKGTGNLYFEKNTIVNVFSIWPGRLGRIRRLRSVLHLLRLSASVNIC